MRGYTILDRLNFTSILASGTLSMWAGSMSKIVAFGVLTPLIVASYDTSNIALWYTTSLILAINALFDLGFSPTFIRYYAFSSNHSPDEIVIEETKGYALPDILSLHNKISLGLAVLSLVALTMVYLVYISPAFMPHIPKLDFLWLVFCAGIVINVLLKPYDCLLKGSGHLPVAYKVDAVASFIFGIAGAISVYLSRDLFTLILIHQFCLSVAAFFKFYLGKKLIGGMIFNGARTFDGHRLLLKNAIKTGLITASTASLLHTLNLLVSVNIGLSLSASYLFSMRLLQVGSEISWPPFYSKIPLLSKLRQSNEIDSLQSLAFGRMRVSLLIYCFAVIAIYEMFNAYTTYVASEVELLSRTVWFLFAIAILLDRCQAMLCQLYVTKNKVDFLSLYVFHGSLVCALAYFLFSSLGINAIAVSLILSQVFVLNPVMMNRALRDFPIRVFTFIFEVLLAPSSILMLWWVCLA